MTQSAAARRVEAESLPAARRAIAQIFVTPDPFAPVLNTGVADPELVVMGPFQPRHNEYDAIVAAAKGVGDLEAFVSIIAGEPRDVSDWTWRVRLDRYPFDELKADRSWSGISPTALYSPHGAWAVLVSDEGHGVVAGVEPFMTEFMGGCRAAGRDVVSLVSGWIDDADTGSSDIEWLRALLQDVYGAARAREIFAAVNQRSP